MTNKEGGSSARSTFSLPIVVLLLLGSVVLPSFTLSRSQAHAASPITPSGLNTKVADPITVNGRTQYDITGGTRPGGGANLFHSFGDFSVPTNNIANFLNETALPTSNILGRVTGGNISNIFGTIQTTNFGPANLFLMNPAGFLFGPNATINVGGMVSFTTADYMRLADGVLFHNTPNVAQDALLSAAPVAAFGFLGSNPGAITVQGSQLSVTPGQSLSLVGGNITTQRSKPEDGTVQSAKLSAPGGQINLASVASPGEILTGTLAQAPNINGQSFRALGTIQVSEQSVIDVSGNGGGTVSIRGGQFVLDNSTISANITGPGSVTNGVEAIGGGIDIQVAQNAVIQPGSLLETNVLGNPTPGVTYGGTHIKADRIEVIGDPGFDFVNGPFTAIHSDVAPGSTGGNSGPIKLEANSILLQDFVNLQTQTDGAGSTSDITLGATGNLEINGSLLQSYSFSPGSGNASSIELTSAQGNILMTNGPLITSQVFGGSGKPGSITVSAPGGDVLLAGVPNELFIPGALFTVADLDSASGGGAIQITAKNLTLANAAIAGDNFSPFVPGNITITLSGTLSLDGQNLRTGFGQNLSNTFIETVARGPAHSADLSITAQNINVTNLSYLSTRTVRSGDGGRLNISANTLELTSGGQIRSGSVINNPRRPVIPTGEGGTVNIQGLVGPADSVLIDGASSGIFTNAEGTGVGGNINILANAFTVQNGGTLNAATSGTMVGGGNGGAILVQANTVNLTAGGHMTASSTGTGAAGQITVQGLASPAQSVVIDGAGSGIFTDTHSTGAGGDIHLSANSVTLQNGAHVSSSSTGTGIAGDITINAGNQFAMTNSTVTTEANQSSGGAIKITTNPSGTVQLTDSTISASVLDGTGGGGSVNIDPQFVLLQNSQILANAVQGPGGNIFITTNLLLPDATSIISASSQFGQNGTITIQSPNAPASGKIQPLGKSPLLATTLLSQRCAALAGTELSSFTVAGRDSLPTEPGGWLASPLAALSAATELVARGEGREGMTVGASPTGETPLLSLRRIAPPGFLTQAFAVDGSDGCTS